MGRPHVWSDRACVVCRADFRAKPSNPKKHCSALCARVTHSRNAIARNAGRDQAGPNNPHWKGDAGSRWAMHKRANKLKPGHACERCGGVGNVVHHKDENPWNNALDNLERLCRSCHAGHHGRIHNNLLAAK